MNRACSICDLDVCKEIDIDDTIGCCLCYNISEKKKGNSEITLCQGCKRYTRTKTFKEDSFDGS